MSLQAEVASLATATTRLTSVFSKAFGGMLRRLDSIDTRLSDLERASSPILITDLPDTKPTRPDPIPTAIEAIRYQSTDP